MTMKNLQNENRTDRIIRLLVAIGAAITGYYSQGTTGYICLVVAAIALISSLSGFSLFYKLVGINTLKR